MTTTMTIEFPSSARMPGVDAGVGVHNGMIAAKYFRMPAANNSLLKEVAKSPLHARHYLDTSDSKETPSLRLGRLLHTRALEPDVFERSTVPPPINDKTGEPYGKQTKAWDAYAAQHAGKDILSVDDLAQIDGMAEALMAHPKARELLTADGENEVVLRWTDPATGLACKGRADRIGDAGIVDLKTCESARDEDFARSVINYSYHVQSAMYCSGVEALDLGAMPYFIVAVESDAPYAVSVFDMTSSEWFGIGLQLARERLATLAACLKSNTWPGYGLESRPLAVPAWYGARFTDGNQM